jgi:hypothetical protein
MSEALIGARVRIVSGPCAGFVGVVTATKKHPAKADVTIGEYRIAFDPPAYLPTAGRLDAVWRRPIDFTVVAK